MREVRELIEAAKDIAKVRANIGAPQWLVDSANRLHRATTAAEVALASVEQPAPDVVREQFKTAWRLGRIAGIQHIGADGWKNDFAALKPAAPAEAKPAARKEVKG